MFDIAGSQKTDDLTVVLEQVMADVDTVSADRSEPDEFEDDETKSTKDNHFPDISPGAGVHDLNQQPRISPLEQTPPPRRRRTRQKHERGRGHGRGRAAWGTRLRKLRNYTLAVAFFILMAFLLFIMREGFSAGLFGITFN